MMLAALIVLALKPPILDIPKDSWEPLFFQTIDHRAKASGLTSLRSFTVPPGDTEVRIWDGFGLMYVQAYIFKRTAGQWSAQHVLSLAPEQLKPRSPLAASHFMKSLGSPKSGWDAFWNEALTDGLMTLPDASKLKNPQMVFDGTSYVVEINQDGKYRTYMYENPDYQKWPQAKQMLKIVALLHREFPSLGPYKPER